MLASGMPLVLVERIVPGVRTAATRSSRLRLMARFSATASTIQSQSRKRPRSSSKLPGAMSDFAASVKNPTGRLFGGVFDAGERGGISLGLIG